MVQAHRTSSNLLEPQRHRDSKVWRGLSHGFGVVRLYRTFSIYIIAGETRCAGCLCTSSGRFKHIEPHRTYSPLLPHHHMECASAVLWTNLSTPCYLCDVVVRVGSMRFDVLEPPRTIAPCIPCFHSRTTPNSCDKPLHTLLSL